MDYNIINLVYIGIVGFVLLLFAITSFFWFMFVLGRLIHYYKSHRELVSRRHYSCSEFDIDIYNCKVKCIMYIFFLLLIICEVVCVLSHCLGTIIFNFVPEFGILSMYPLDIFINCTESGFEIWEIELINPLMAFFLGLRDITLFGISILVIGLIKFIFLAYQMRKDLSGVKIFIIKASAFLPFLLLFSVIPQTQVLSKAANPIFGIILTFLLFKHKKRYYMILKWRCDDAFIQRDVASYRYHLKIKRNSILLFNLILISTVLLIFTLALNKFSSLASMLLTEQSRYVTGLFKLDTNLAIIDCKYQQFIYKFHSIIDAIEPLFCLISALLYYIPYLSIAIGVLVITIYRRISSRNKAFQTRFEGNAHLFDPPRV